jgi:hypothetical protein
VPVAAIAAPAPAPAARTPGGIRFAEEILVPARTAAPVDTRRGDRGRPGQRRDDREEEEAAARRARAAGGRRRRVEVEEDDDDEYSEYASRFR